MPQREVYKPPVRGGVLDAPPSDDGRRRLHAGTFPTRVVGAYLPRPPGVGGRTPWLRRTNGARAVPLRYMPQREVYKPPVRGGVPDAPPSDDGRCRLHAETFPTRTVGEGFHALPAWDEGQHRFARLKWCAGCARGIWMRGAVDGSGRAVGDAGAVGQAGRMQPTRPGNPANTGRRGRRPLRARGKPRYLHRGKQAHRRRKPPPSPRLP